MGYNGVLISYKETMQWRFSYVFSVLRRQDSRVDEWWRYEEMRPKVIRKRYEVVEQKQLGSKKNVCAMIKNVNEPRNANMWKLEEIWEINEKKLGGEDTTVELVEVMQKSRLAWIQIN